MAEGDVAAGESEELGGFLRGRPTFRPRNMVSFVVDCCRIAELREYSFGVRLVICWREGSVMVVSHE